MESLPFGATEAAIVLLIATFGAMVQSAAGFGLALISAPPLLLIYGPLVPGPLMAASLVLAALVAQREHSHIDLSGVAYAMLGRVFGTVAASAFLVVASQAAFDLAFGCLVLMGVALSAAGLRFRPNRRSAVLAGGLSGLMGTISAIGGPPMALLYQRSGAAELRSTLAGYFLLGTTLSIFALFVIGRFGAEELWLSAFLTPPMVIGFALAGPLRDRLREGAVRPMVLGLSFVSGAVVLLRALW